MFKVISIYIYYIWQGVTVISKLKINIFNLLTEIYIAVIIIVFPLLVDKAGFFKILECKYRCFTFISSIYTLLLIILILYYFIFSKDFLKNSIKFTKVQIAIIVFLFINVVSCFISPFFKGYNLFIGVGRGEGLILISLYCLKLCI